MAKKKTGGTPNAPKPVFKTMVADQTNEVPTYYVNSASIDISSFDVRFRLGQILGLDNDVLRIKEVAYMFMSHAHFKAFADLVNKHLTAVENAEPVRRISADDKKPH